MGLGIALLRKIKPTFDDGGPLYVVHAFELESLPQPKIMFMPFVCVRESAYLGKHVHDGRIDVIKDNDIQGGYYSFLNSDTFNGPVC